MKTKSVLTTSIVIAFLSMLPLISSGEGASVRQTQGVRSADVHAVRRATQQREPEDSAIFAARVAWAKATHADTLPIGELVVRVGRTFVGAPYVPGSLEADGPEHLVVNLRTFDCVTFVESSLAIARAIRMHGTYNDFRHELARIRYRGGKLAGYPSRLHYFSDWIGDNEKKGIVTSMTRDLGGIPDSEPITFMTSHVGSYRQLTDTKLIPAIRATEKRLTRQGRLMVPEDSIAAVASRIHSGDIIAVTTTTHGIDVSHTGIALWDDGVLRLMHAPLVGTVVQISETSLAERVKASKTQDGIMVARPR